MGDVLPIAIGPTLSVLFFLIGYRRTVGARKERARAAELEVERLLVRRVIVDGYTPSWDDLARLVQRKARQHRVKISDLASEPEFMTAIYTEVLENEFVAHAERETILARLQGVLEARKRRDATQESEFEYAVDAAIDSEDRRALERQRRIVLTAVGALAAVLGTFASVLASVGQADTDQVERVTTVAAVSAVLVALVAVIVRQRDRLERGDRPESVRSPADFEQKVAHLLSSEGVHLMSSAVDTPVDFVVQLNGHRVGVEVSSTIGASTGHVRTMLRAAARAVAEGAVDEVVLTLPEVPAGARNLAGPVRVVDLKGLREYLRSRMKGAPTDT